MRKFRPLSTLITLLLSAVLVHTAPAQNLGTARVNGAPQINSGRVEGNVQQMTGANATLNSGAVITDDLLVPGTPTLIKNGTMNFGGTIVGTGSTSPSNYQVILNGAITLGHLRTRTNPVAIPALPAVPSPTGTRTVTITAAGQSIGNFSTLRNLTLNGNVGQYAIPAGTYGDFIANGGSGFTLGVAGATQAAVYNLQHLTLNGQTNIIVLGPVVINVANGFTANGTAGTSTNPARLKLNIVAGGFTLNSGCNIYGYVTAPNGTVIINGATKLVGGCISAALTVNANGLLQLFDATSFDNNPPAVAITSPAAGAVFNAGSAITLVASATDPDGSVAKVEFFAGTTKLGEATSSPWTYSWQNAVAGSYQLTAIATDNLGAKTTSAAVSISVNAPPTVGLTAPANQSVFQAGSIILLTANAADSDGTIQKVEFFAGGAKLGEKTTAPYSFSWNNAPAGPHALTAKATDNNGAQTVSATVNIRVNFAPAVAMTAPANGSVAQAGSTIPLAASASDGDGTITKVEFYAGATKVGEDTSSPYQFNWSNAPAGQHSLTAKATDNDGAQTISAPINLTINAPPAVGISSPATAQIFNPGATIAITANASDPDGTVTKVEFFSGTTKIGEASASPWAISWPAPAPGVYQLSAKATDDRGAQTTSSSVSITINAPPTVAISSPSDQAVVQPGNPILLTANASDSDGTITEVEFFAGATKLGESFSAPFTFSWGNAASGSYTITAKATDNASASAVSAPIHLRVNGLPAISLTDPAQGATFNTGDPITLSASATDPDDGITKVEFFAGGAKIGEAIASPYSITWSGAPEGASILTARAEDGSGASATSAPVTINVTTVNAQLTVDAGPDRLISLPGAATLEGEVLLNGGPPGPEVALEWSLVSGPGAVTFSAPNSSSTSASFTQAGNYLIRLTASNIDGANFDTTAVTVLAAPLAGPDSPVSNQGREFWMAFLSNPSFHEPTYSGTNLNISSETAATGTVEIFDSFQVNEIWEVSRRVKTFSVAAGGKTVVDVNSGTDYHSEWDQVRSTSVHIVADAPVAIHALNYKNATTDGSLILPTSLLGLDHFIMSYRNGETSQRVGSECAIVATKAQTSVTITPTSPTGPHPAGQPFTVTLQTGEVYRFFSGHDGEDLTGTRVQSDKPVAVYGGHVLAYVPFNVPYADHLYEQIPPVDLWGRHFVTVPLRGRNGGDLIRLLASNDNTHVSINGEVVAILNRGQFYETVLTQPASILADQRILVGQLAQGTELDHTIGDPFLTLVPPYETFGRHYIIATPYFRNYDRVNRVYVVSDPYDSYLTLVVDSAHAADVRVNGQPVDPAQFFPIADTGFSAASVSVPKNSTLDISSPAPVGTLLYGWAPAESYGYTGGSYGALDSAAAQFTLTQSASAAPVGSSHRVRAQLVNSAGLTVPDATVSFSVTGANPTTGSGLTSADGSVEFSWQGAQAGVDTITATSGVLTATVSVNWVALGANQPPQVNAGADVLVALGQPLALHGVVQDDGHPGGNITLQWSALPGPGDVTFADPTSADTTASFVYSGQYRLRLTAYDGQFAGDDDLLVTVDIPPAFWEVVPYSDVVDAGTEWKVGVSAIDRDGLIARIDLIEGTQILATIEPNRQTVNYQSAVLSTTFTVLGPHFLTIRLTDNQGATADSSLTVTVRPAPVVQILSPADNTTFAAGESVSFTASASSAGGPIVRVVYNEVTEYSYELGDGTGSNYQLTWTPSYAGTFLISATAYDSEGASGTSAPITVTVLSPGDPTVTITSPANCSSIYPGQTLTVHADVTAFLPAEVYEVDFIDGYQYIGSSYSPPFEVQWTPYDVGSHTLTAYVYDTFGGFAQTSVTINVVEPPNLNITLVQPRPNTPIKVNTPTTLAANIENVIGTLEEVYFYANGEWLGGGSNNSVSWTPTAVGDYQIEVYAYSYGPYQNGYLAANVTVADLHSPVVQWTSPANNASFPPNTPIVLQAQASDVDANLSKLEFLADDQLLSETPLSGGAGVASCTWDNAGPGWHALTALATDDTLQSSDVFLQIFVERTVTNELLPPSALTSEAMSPNGIELAWSASISATSTGTIIERRAQVDGLWEEIATVDPTTVTYQDGNLEPETYYSYRLASLDDAGARSIYSEESSATTLIQMPHYVAVDITENLAQSGITAHFIDFKHLIAANGPTGIAGLIDLDGSRALSINDNNDVLVDGGSGNYAVWRLQGQASTITAGQQPIVARGMNAQGIVAGSRDHSYQDSEGNVHLEFHALTWTNGADQDITPQTSIGEYHEPRGGTQRGLSDYEVFEAYGIGDSGDVVGRATVYYQDYDYSGQHAALWSGSQWTNLGGFAWLSDNHGRMLPSFATATALVSGNKQVIGVGAIDLPQLPSYPPGTGPQHAFLSNGRNWDAPGRTFQDLGTLGGYESAAWGINKNGVVIGVSTTSTSDPAWRLSGFVWEGQAPMYRLPILPHGTNTNYPQGYTYPIAINDNLQIVGQSLRRDGSYVASRWAKNENKGAPAGSQSRYEVVDLNTLINDDNWGLISARGINNSGYIVGQGVRFQRDSNGNVINQQQRAYLLIPVGFQEMISDQIANNEANKLPNGKPYAGDPNNPLLMASRAGVQSNIAVRIDFLDSLNGKIFVGVRKVGSSTVVKSMQAVRAPEKTLIEFDADNFTAANAQDLSNLYEAVAGYDNNGNGSLDQNEVSLVFQETQNVDSIPPHDKFRVITQSWYDSCAETLLEISNSPLPTGFAGDFLNNFITGNGLPDAEYSTFQLTSTYPGLAHPVGAKWSSSNDASATLRTFNPGTPVSDAVLNSVAVRQVAQKTIDYQKAEIITYFVQHPNEAAHSFTYAFWPKVAKDVEFKATEGSFSPLFLAFNKVDLHGTVTVQCQPLGDITSTHRFLVTSAEVNGNFTDLYDFNYYTPPYNHLGVQLDLALWAASVQAGYATFSTHDRPSGRVSKNHINFRGVQQWNQVFETN
jgi:hypothetical protein